MDIGSVSVFNRVVKTLPIELKTNWFAYSESYDNIYENMRVFSAWLKKIAQAQENSPSQFGSSSNKAKTSFTRDKVENKNFAAASESSSPTRHNVLWRQERTKPGNVMHSRKWSFQNAKRLSRNVFSVFVGILYTGLSSKKPIELVAKMDAPNIIMDTCKVTKIGLNLEKKLATIVRKQTMPTQCSQETRIAGVRRLFPSRFREGTLQLKNIGDFWYRIHALLRGQGRQRQY